MTDPRIKRTRDHVLRVAREMLAEAQGTPLTLSALAARAQVSRRTLYVHWGTIQHVIRDSVAQSDDEPLPDSSGLSPRQVLRVLLLHIRELMQEPTNSVAYATMVSQAAQDAAAAEVLRSSGEELYERFVTMVGPLTFEQYAQLVGPLSYAAFIGREPASDQLIDDLVERGAQMLNLEAEVAEPI